MVPDHIIHAQANEPAQHKVIVQSPNQLTLGADCEQNLQQLRSSQLFRWYRRATHTGIHIIERVH